MKTANLFTVTCRTILEKLCAFDSSERKFSFFHIERYKLTKLNSSWPVASSSQLTVIGQYNEAVAGRVRILDSGIARDLATDVLIGHCPGCTDGQGARDSRRGVHVVHPDSGPVGRVSSQHGCSAG